MGRRTPLALLFCAAAAAQTDETFEKNVRPILASRCQACHHEKAAIDLRKVEPARLLEAVSYTGKIKMPPTGRLSDAELGQLRAWIATGGQWPSAKKPGDFWAFRPLQAQPLPNVKNKAWIQSPIDRFVLAALEAQGLTPAPPADRLTWLQRVTLDLTGLPPADADLQAFFADTTPQARARVVDRLLASPRYGEKWGRHWLDVARYADSTGADEDYRYPHAWRYRDYVIDAFNRDLPYDQFLREQLAGDLLPPPAGQAVNANGIIATGFLALGPKLVAEQDKVKMFYDIVDEQIDTAGKAILGLTIACARCHDHKFDPVSTKDYYALASIFASTKQLAQLEGTVSKLYYAPLVPKAEAARYEAHQEQLAAKQKEIDSAIAREGVRYRDERSSKLAQSMLAAYRVYAEGAAAPDAEVERWATYLKPTKERRPQLERWYQATAAQRAAVAQQYQEEFLAEVDRRKRLQGKVKFLAGDNRFYTEVAAGKGPLTLPDKDRDQHYTAETKQKLAKLNVELAAIKAAAPPEPPFACGVAEDKAVEQHVFVRGNPEAKGDAVPKRFPLVLAGENQPPITTISGRLEFANWLASGQHPLPARVMVNRLWQGHFGQGLVRTPNNFGLTGERPTHPALLDWLAAEFMRQGWSIKKLHRLLVLSSTYAMSSAATAVQRERDADNRLLSRFAIRRKTVEEIRDSLLMLDGTLDLTVGGSLQKGEGTDNEFSDGRKSIHPDSTTRRTVYLPIRRSNLSTLFTLYDFGDGTTSTDVREQTNVAPQALYMMNSKFVAERTRGLARQLLQQETADEARIGRAWRTVLGREPSAGERKDALAFLANYPGQKNNELAWTSLCRSLVAGNDFIYVY